MMLRSIWNHHKEPIVSDTDEFSTFYQNIIGLLMGTYGCEAKDADIPNSPEIMQIDSEYDDFVIGLTASKINSKSLLNRFMRHDYELRLSISIRNREELYRPRLDNLSEIYGLEKVQEKGDNNIDHTCKSGNCMIAKKEDLRNVYNYEKIFTAKEELNEYIRKNSKKTL